MHQQTDGSIFMKLNHRQCLAAAPKERPYKLSDGLGLYLEVMPSGAKYWKFQYRFGGKRPRLSFGVFPEVTLNEARVRRDSNRRLLRNGKNPISEHKREKLLQAVAANNTFEAVAREWHELQSPRWTVRHRSDVLTRFERDVFPLIGTMPVSDLTAPEILVTVRKIEERGALELAARALQNIGRVCRYAIATGRAERDPTYKLWEALRPQQPKHYAAIECSELPEFVLALRSNRARLFLPTLIATELLMLTFVRTGELVKAKWQEFDFEENVWRIPAERMKMNRDHLVPLSTQVINRLEQLRAINAGRPYVLPHHSDPRKHISNNTVLTALKRMGYKGRMTGHGFRALAMSTIKEKLGYRHEVIDRQLAHVQKSKVDRAYDRAEFLSDRKRMMQDWADFIDECAQKVVAE